SAHRNQSVMEDRQYGGHSIDPFEAKSQVNQHSGQRIKGGQDGFLGGLLANLRADNLNVADTEVGDEEIVLERGDDGGIGHTLQLIYRTQHASFCLVAIVDNRLTYG